LQAPNYFSAVNSKCGFKFLLTSEPFFFQKDHWVCAMAFCRLVVWVHSCSGHLFCQPWCLSLGLASITLWLQLCCQELITISCLCSCSVGARLAFLCDRASAQLGGMVTLEEMSPIYGAELAFSAEHSHMCRLHVRSVMESGRDQLSVWGTAGTGLGHVSCSLMNQHL